MQEYFDVLFADGTPLGEVKSRQHVHKNGDWHQTVLLLALAERPVLTLNKAEVEAVQYLDWRIFQQRLQTGAESFVPHKEEYAKLFEFLSKI